MNPGKTQIIFIDPNKKSIYNKHQFIFNTQILYLTEKVHNLGVIFNTNHDMLSFISIKIRNANFHLYRIRKIRKSITFKTYKSIVTSLVLFTLDYCNILLINLTAKDLEPLVKLQKRAVRIIYNLPYRSINNDICITRLMTKLHWLKVSSRIKYKLLVLTHLAYHHHTPSYLAGLIQPHIQERSLRSVHLHRLEAAPLSFSQRDHSRAFRIVGPNEWNKLPFYFRLIINTLSFKAKLKTYLFSIELC